MELINCTPHAIHVLNEDNVDVLVLKPSGSVPRAAQNRVQVDTLTTANGTSVPVNRSVFGQVEGLPESADGVYFVVSMLTAQAATDRDDLLVVDDTVRDEAGRIIGCRAFSRV